MTNNEVDSLKNKINEMVTITQNSINLVVDALSAFSNTKHKYKEIAKCSNKLGEFTKTAQSLQESVSEVLKMVDNTLEKIMLYLYSLPKKTTLVGNFINNVKELISSINLKTQEIKLSANYIAV